MAGAGLFKTLLEASGSAWRAERLALRLVLTTVDRALWRPVFVHCRLKRQFGDRRTTGGTGQLESADVDHRTRTLVVIHGLCLSIE